MKYKIIIFSVTLILIFTSWYAYEKGYISTSFKLLKTTELNPFDGEYRFDATKINSEHIKKSLEMRKQLNADILVLRIEGANATLLGYQFNSKVRSRWFTVCLENDGITLNSGGQQDYCEIPYKSKYQLRFKSPSAGILICDNCENEDFPSYWIR